MTFPSPPSFPGIRIGLVASFALLTLGLSACAEQAVDLRTPLASYQGRMAAEPAADTGRGPQVIEDEPRIYPVAGQEQLGEREALLTDPNVPAPEPAMVLVQIADPSDASKAFSIRRARVVANTLPTDQRVVRNFDRVVAYALDLLKRVERPKQLRLSLAEAVQRALANNYAIRVQSYQPAISQTQLVEAEAAFDAEFFLTASYNRGDSPVPNQLQAGESDIRTIEGGLRKLLPTGMTVQTSLNMQRQFINFQFQTLNPAYSSSWRTTFNQPLLRGFGLDFNRALINIRRAERKIAFEQFEQQVRDSLRDVEVAYWQLAQARRRSTILAEQVGQTYTTFQNMEERLAHDATPIEYENSKARWKSREVEFSEAVLNVRNAEDQLKNLINDPGLLLSETIEIIPIDTPYVAPLAIDQFAEVRTAIDERSEIRQGKLAIEQTRIQTAQAKNQTLPQLDLSFTYEVGGLGSSGDNSFDNLTTNRFISYNVALNFSMPIGNRARLAAWNRARLQESQAVVSLKQVMDAIVQEVNTAVRTLVVRYSQLPTQLEAVLAAEMNLIALQARAGKIDPNYLETELSAVEQLANTRTILLQVVTDYNTSIIQLERAKGTLLEYNNVVVSDEPGGA